MHTLVSLLLCLSICSRSARWSAHRNFDGRHPYRPGISGKHNRTTHTQKKAAERRCVSMMMIVLTAGFESIPQETFTVCLMAALITVDSARHTGGSARVWATSTTTTGFGWMYYVVRVRTGPHRNLCKSGRERKHKKGHRRCTLRWKVESGGWWGIGRESKRTHS